MPVFWGALGSHSGNKRHRNHKKEVNTKDIGMAVRVEPGYIEQLNEIYHVFQMGFKMSFVVIGVIRWTFSMMFSGCSPMKRLITWPLEIGMHLLKVI
jgi:hypothetical protein